LAKSSKAARAVSVGVGSLVDIGGRATYRAAKRLTSSQRSSVTASWRAVGRDLTQAMKVAGPPEAAPGTVVHSTKPTTGMHVRKTPARMAATTKVSAKQSGRTR
jgi:hypothetical protein